MRLHADRVDDRVGAAAVGRLGDRALAVLAEVEDLDSIGRRARPTLRHRIDTEDPLHASLAGDTA